MHVNGKTTNPKNDPLIHLNISITVAISYLTGMYKGIVACQKSDVCQVHHTYNGFQWENNQGVWSLGHQISPWPCSPKPSCFLSDIYSIIWTLYLGTLADQALLCLINLLEGNHEIS